MSGKRNFFRNGDRVTVHNLMAAHGKPVPGRVVCVNRKSKYGMPVVVLCDVGPSELIEAFTAEGGRYLKESSMRITLGYPSE